MKYMLIASLLFTLTGCSKNLPAPPEPADAPPVEAIIQSPSLSEKLDTVQGLLFDDGGAMWGKDLWSDKVLINDGNQRVYTPRMMDGAEEVSPGLFALDIGQNEISATNTVQDFRGERFVTVVESAFEADGRTLIHELFHLMQEETVSFKGDPVPYLEQTEARKLLRAEFAAYRIGLTAMRGGDVDAASRALHDAMLFRHQRERQYPEGKSEATQIESLEGLANYTGLALSAVPDKYEVALKWLDDWESTQTYTRTYPYATGPAYGLLMDGVDLEWRQNPSKPHDFLTIYNTVSGQSVTATNTAIAAAKDRVGFAKIEIEEDVRRAEQEKATAFYEDLFYNKPVLTAWVDDPQFAMSFSMNNTMSLDDARLIYTYAKGVDHSGGLNFGSFETDEDAELGKFGILGERIDGRSRFTFPAPDTIEGNSLTHPSYRIDLTPGWTIERTDDPRISSLVRVE